MYKWGDIIKRVADGEDWVGLGPGMDRFVVQDWRASCQW